MKIHRASWLLLCFAFVFIGCEGEEGAVGPQGPPGTANVIYSDWFSPATWELGSSFGVVERSFTMTTSLLTQEIIDHGAVLVYMRFVGWTPAICQLPATVYSTGQTYCFQFRAWEGNIKAYYYFLSSPAADPGVIPADNVVRYVLIPGGALATTARIAGMTPSQLAGSLNAMPYSEVCGLFDIPE